jgi:hypothetical protein
MANLGARNEYMRDRASLTALTTARGLGFFTSQKPDPDASFKAALKGITDLALSRSDGKPINLVFQTSSAQTNNPLFKQLITHFQTPYTQVSVKPASQPTVTPQQSNTAIEDVRPVRRHGIG